jgi:predicted transcriptional regulator
MTIKPKDTSVIRKTSMHDSRRFGIVIEHEDLDKLQSIAFAMHTTASEIIRQLVHEYVKKETRSDKRRQGIQAD